MGFVIMCSFTLQKTTASVAGSSVKQVAAAFAFRQVAAAFAFRQVAAALAFKYVAGRLISSVEWAAAAFVIFWRELVAVNAFAARTDL